MLYLFHTDAGHSQLTLVGDEHRYLFKVRRHKIEDQLYLRNLQDHLLYRYRITHLDKRAAILELEQSEVLKIKAKKSLHIAWCVIDSKSVEKVLPTLNELGVAKITFLYCARSQKSFTLDFKRLEKILLGSSQQSGRSEMMQLEMGKDLQGFLASHPEAKMLNFSKTHFVGDTPIKTIVIGCEGGFTQEERALFGEENIVGLDTSLVLKSESAVCAVASKLLL